MPKEPRVKRKPSSYNLFIKKCMSAHSDEMKGKPFGAAAPFLKECTEEWKGLDEQTKISFKEKADRCELIDDKWECPD